ncbi:MAG: DUF309 domain-containing protein [Pirellulales bacterium]|nr:DUF309 domain-containing protein [Pirellulales bacterium]
MPAEPLSDADEALVDDALYRQGIEHFNACDFFEAHEVWEELWTDYRGPLRKFFQGLIQSAVALHHFGNGNLRGARKVYGTSRAYLTDYRPGQLGLDLDKFLADFDRCFAPLVDDPDAMKGIEVDPETIPEIHLQADSA